MPRDCDLVGLGLVRIFKSSPGYSKVQQNLKATTLEWSYDLKMQRKQFGKEKSLSKINLDLLIM